MARYGLRRIPNQRFFPSVRRTGGGRPKFSQRVRRTLDRRSETKRKQLYNGALQPTAGDALYFSFASLIDRGTGGDERIGNQINVYETKVDYVVSLTTVNGGFLYVSCRAMVIVPRGTATTDPNELDENTIGLWNNPDPTKYKVLKDWKFRLGSENPAHGSGSSPSFKRIYWSKNWKGMTWTYPVNKQPIFYFYCDLPNSLPANPSTVYFRGIRSVSFKDI